MVDLESVKRISIFVYSNTGGWLSFSGHSFLLCLPLGTEALQTTTTECFQFSKSCYSHNGPSQDTVDGRLAANEEKPGAHRKQEPRQQEENDRSGTPRVHTRDHQQKAKSFIKFTPRVTSRRSCVSICSRINKVKGLEATFLKITAIFIRTH